MAVVIENLRTEEAVAAPAPPVALEAPRESAPDERKLIETLAFETWAAQRLMAD
jgi:hypothetical protein